MDSIGTFPLIKMYQVKVLHAESAILAVYANDQDI